MNKIYKLSPLEPWSEITKRITNKEILTVVFQVTEDCCMSCSYCYQHHKTINSMNWEIAKAGIDQILNYPIDNYGTVIYEFIGGEPLMNIDLIEQICEYTINQMIEMKHPWLPLFHCSICSNGLLYFNNKIQHFFQKYNHFVELNISIDGNQELHDSCRKDLNGNPTYEKVIKAVNHYRANYGTMNHTKMTLSPQNILYTSEAIINLIQEKYKYINCNCIFEEGWNYSHAKILYNELKIIGDYILDNNLYDKIYIRFFSEYQYQPLLETDNENWCGGTCNSILPTYYSIKYDGQIFPCIRYMNSSLSYKQKELPIGHVKIENYIKDYSDNKQLLSNITRRSQSTDECFNCTIAAGCGWCSGYNYEKFGTPNKRATYLCCMHQAAALANVYYWNKLYQKLNIDKKFKMYISKEWALNIIDELEYNYLFNLSEKGE